MRKLATTVMAALMSVVALAGCATPPLLIQRGGIGGGLYLLTMVVADAGRVPELCASPGAAGCHVSLPMPRGAEHVSISFITLRRDDGAADSTYYIMAHETCHALARAQKLTVDPCHFEDGGFVEIR